MIPARLKRIEIRNARVEIRSEKGTQWMRSKRHEREKTMCAVSISIQRFVRISFSFMVNYREKTMGRDISRIPNTMRTGMSFSLFFFLSRTHSGSRLWSEKYQIRDDIALMKRIDRIWYVLFYWIFLENWNRTENTSHEDKERDGEERKMREKTRFATADTLCYVLPMMMMILL